MTDQQIDEFLEMLAKSPTSARDMVRGLFAAHEQAAPAVPQGDLASVTEIETVIDWCVTSYMPMPSNEHAALLVDRLRHLCATPAAPSQPVTDEGIAAVWRYFAGTNQVIRIEKDRFANLVRTLVKLLPNPAPSQEPMRSLTVPDDLPGMWDHADLSGGETDAAPSQPAVPRGEPVGWRVSSKDDLELGFWLDEEGPGDDDMGLHYEPLYTAAPPQEPVTLTEDEIDANTVWFDPDPHDNVHCDLYATVNKCIAALREKEQAK